MFVRLFTSAALRVCCGVTSTRQRVSAKMDGDDFPQRTPQNDAKRGLLDDGRTEQPRRRQEVFDVFGQDAVPLALVLVVLLLSKPDTFITRVPIDVTDLMGAAMTRCTC